MAFWKRLAKFGIIQFFNDLENGNNAGFTFVGRPRSGVEKSCISMQSGVSIGLGLNKIQVTQRITANNAAITTGIAAQSQTAIKALTTLTTAAQVITSFAGQPDTPRCIRIVAAKTGATGVGDGTFTSANARYVIVTGTDINDLVITEWIPLNDTTAVNGVRCFKTVTSITLPIRVNSDAGDQVSVGYGLVFGLMRPVDAAGDMIEFARKASAATAYTIETLPATTDIGEATAVLDGNHTADDTTITVDDGSVFTSGAQRTIMAIEHKSGDVEEVICTSRTNNVLTVVRGANGTTALAAVDGCQISKRPGMSFATTLTANDRLLISYQTPVV